MATVPTLATCQVCQVVFYGLCPSTLLIRVSQEGTVVTPVSSPGKIYKMSSQWMMPLNFCIIKILTLELEETREVISDGLGAQLNGQGP